MPRLIYKDNLIEMCNAFADSSRLLWKVFWKEFAKTVEEIAEVDAEPVRHGHWEWDGDYICSNCRERGHRNKWNYCPSCGAKMDEERIDDVVSGTNGTNL